jgi:hypothetical protein
MCSFERARRNAGSDTRDDAVILKHQHRTPALFAAAGLFTLGFDRMGTAALMVLGLYVGNRLLNLSPDHVIRLIGLLTVSGTSLILRAIG